MVRVTRLVAVVVAILGLLAGCSGDEGSEPSGDPAAASSSGSSGTAGGDDEPYQPTDEDRQQIRALLRTRANALEQGDRPAFLATVDPDDDKLVKQQTTLYDNLQLLPVESVSYSVDDSAGYPTADVEGDDPVFRPLVLEQVRLDVDERPVTQHPRGHVRPARRSVAAGRGERPRQVPRRPRATVTALGGAGADRGRPVGPAAGGHRPRRRGGAPVTGRRHRRRHPVRRRGAGDPRDVRRAGRRHHGGRRARDEQRGRPGGRGRDVRGRVLPAAVATPVEPGCGSRSTRTRRRGSPRTTR